MRKYKKARKLEEVVPAYLKGARVAEKRLKDLNAGKSRKVSEKEIEELLNGEERAMKTDQKALFEDAMRLPRKTRVKLAEKLLLSLDDEDSDLEESILEGAKLAHKRIQACLRGKEKTVSEEEIIAMLDEPR
jgi:hypothetical protein